jgi:prepilin-type processing-associated H-X9-DG protein
MKTISAGVSSNTCPEECRWHYDKDKPDGTLWPYMQNIKAHICPTFKSLAKNGTCWNWQNHPRTGRSGTMPYNPTYCYSMNRWLGFFPPLAYYSVPTDSPEAQAMIAPEPSLKLSQVRRSAQCCAFSEENFWPIERRPGENKEYSETPIGKNDLWLYANKALKDATQGNTQGNLATYHNVSSGKRDEGSANVVFVDGHVSLTKGLAGYGAYFEYGRPYNGHETLPIW